MAHGHIYTLGRTLRLRLGNVVSPFENPENSNHAPLKQTLRNVSSGVPRLLARTGFDSKTVFRMQLLSKTL